MATKNEAGLEFVWIQSLKQMDRWVKQEEFQEDIFLQTVKQIGENGKQNIVNLKEATEQLSTQLQAWEKTSREQFLTMMTPMHQFFSIHSFEQIDGQLNDIRNKTAKIASTPFQYLLKEDYLDSYMSTVEKYVQSRRNNRETFVKKAKEVTSRIYRNQNAAFQMVKNMFFPLDRYMEQPNERA